MCVPKIGFGVHVGNKQVKLAAGFDTLTPVGRSWGTNTFDQTAAFQNR
jgi:hypothetical protein